MDYGVPWSPARLLCPWDFPGKNPGFLFRSLHNQALPISSLKLREKFPVDFILESYFREMLMHSRGGERDKGQKGLLPGGQKPLKGFTTHLPTCACT